MEVKFKCGPGKGKTLAQAIRQYMISSAESWKPIGFNFTNGSSIVLNDNIVQSAVKFMADLNKLEFECKSDGMYDDFVQVNYRFTGELYSDDLTKDGVVCNTKGVKLLQSIEEEDLAFTLYFRRAAATLSNEDNYSFLQDRLEEDRLSFPVMRSTHYVVSRVSYTVDSYDTYDKVTFIIGDNINAKEEIMNAVSRLIDSLDTIQYE